MSYKKPDSTHTYSEASIQSTNRLHHPTCSRQFRVQSTPPSAADGAYGGRGGRRAGVGAAWAVPGGGTAGHRFVDVHQRKMDPAEGHPKTQHRKNGLEACRRRMSDAEAT